jgi:hypothetical protein
MVYQALFYRPWSVPLRSFCLACQLKSAGRKGKKRSDSCLFFSQPICWEAQQYLNQDGRVNQTPGEAQTDTRWPHLICKRFNFCAPYPDTGFFPLPDGFCKLQQLALFGTSDLGPIWWQEQIASSDCRKKKRSKIMQLPASSVGFGAQRGFLRFAFTRRSLFLALS